MVDDKLVSDFSYPASPGDYFPPILGDPGEEVAADPSLSLGRDYIQVSRSLSVQTITTATITSINFDTVDYHFGTRADVNLTDDAQNISLSGGLWFLLAEVDWASNATGHRRLSIRLSDAPSQFMSGEFAAALPDAGLIQESKVIIPIPATQSPLAALRLCDIQVYHTRGANLDVEFALLRAFRLRDW